jgi:TonB family protein
VPVPAFVVALPSWPAVFLRNLKDLLWTAEPPRLRLASKPGTFWSDVFVASGPAWGKFAQSVVLHAGAAGALWVTILLWPRPAQVVDRPVFHHEDVIYYSASDYLPPLDTGGAHTQVPHKGEPALAPQPIISVPPESDNRAQTIVAPPNVKLNHDVPMPNVVAWTRTVPVPMAATSRSIADARAASLSMQPVAPAPDTAAASSRRMLPAPQAAIVEPPPTVDSSIRHMADLNIGRSQAVAPAPLLPMGAQRSATARPTLGNPTASVAPPSPAVQNAGLSSSGERLIALGIHPVPTAPVEAPSGNRRGTFAATPQGKPGAAGTPDIPVSANRGNGGQAIGAGDQKSIPPGLHVGAGPDSANHSTIAGSGQGQGTGGNGSSSATPKISVLMAKAEPPRVSAVPRRASPEENAPESEADKQIFGDRKFHAMTLNVPNLNSAGGSWVIHFAELNNEDDEKTDLTSPAAIAIADPAYPLELMKENARGSVTLYAVIRSDGSVANVRVLNSSDDRLEPYARDAFARWHFRPATKSGNPVDLAAVVIVPFRPGKIRSGF